MFVHTFILYSLQLFYFLFFFQCSLQLVVLIFERVNSYEKTKTNSSTNIWPTDSSLEDDLHVSGTFRINKYGSFLEYVFFKSFFLQKRAKNPGWSAWSEWSTCSRTCDGGVAYQLRRCHAPHGCKGEGVRYKICNMQPCPEVQDFRAQQCSAYDDVPYDGALFKWSPHYDYAEPCAVTCRFVHISSLT
jgi:hypothetical protein